MKNDREYYRALEVEADVDYLRIERSATSGETTRH